jgi:hypothetical protein
MTEGDEAKRIVDFFASFLREIVIATLLILGGTYLYSSYQERILTLKENLSDRLAKAHQIFSLIQEDLKKIEAKKDDATLVPSLKRNIASLTEVLRTLSDTNIAGKAATLNYYLQLKRILPADFQEKLVMPELNLPSDAESKKMLFTALADLNKASLLPLNERKERLKELINSDSKVALLAVKDLISLTKEDERSVHEEIIKNFFTRQPFQREIIKELIEKTPWLKLG